MVSYEEIETTIDRAREGITFGYKDALAYLSDRGIDSEIIEAARIQIFPAAQLFSRVYGGGSRDDRLAIVFPHHDVAGDLIDWWSARLVETVKPLASTQFLQGVERGKTRGKMTCPPDNPPHGYLIPTMDWSQLKQGDTIYVHESCIKALNGGRFSTYSVGLNGVWGFTSSKHRVELVPELLNLPWRERGLSCKIVFDSNAVDNPDVQRAISSLTERLDRLCGVRARHILLPLDHEGQHQGFDDFAVRSSVSDVEGYLAGEGGDVELGELARHKIRLNEEVCVVRSLSRVATLASGTLMSRAAFTDVNYANLQARTVNGDGDVKLVSSARMWLLDTNRREVERLDYMPGEELIAHDALNTWRGMGIQPEARNREDDLQWFLGVLYNNTSEVNVKYILDWLAYPLQNLGCKMNVYQYWFGQSGVGKNRLVAPLAMIYGRNFTTVTKSDIVSDFNTPFLRKQLINLDEISGGRQDQDKIAQKIKRLTTGETMQANEKGVPQYDIRNTANYILTSNYADGIRLDDDDRRAFVVRFENTDDHKRDRDYWDEYTWEMENGGAAGLYHYLLERDVGGFDPHSPAPMSKEKNLVISATRSQLEQWCLDLLDDPDTMLGMPNVSKCVFTTRDLAVIYYAKAIEDISKRELDSLGSQLRNAGFEQANEGKVIKVKGNVTRYWVVKNRDKVWLSEDVQSNLK